MNHLKFKSHFATRSRTLASCLLALAGGGLLSGCPSKSDTSSLDTDSGSVSAAVVADAGRPADNGPSTPGAADPADSGEPEETVRVEAVIDGGNEESPCGACREAKCRTYEGVDLIDGCYKYLDSANGAPKKDATFNQECADIVQCARKHNCAYGEKGPAACYCGSASIDQCATKGPAADAKCVPEWQAGARSKVNTDMHLRFVDLGYPAGWAYALLDHCDRELCAAECTSAKKKGRAAKAP